MAPTTMTLMVMTMAMTMIMMVMMTVMRRHAPPPDAKPEVPSFL